MQAKIFACIIGKIKLDKYHNYMNGKLQQNDQCNLKVTS